MHFLVSLGVSGEATELNLHVRTEIAARNLLANNFSDITAHA